MSTNEQSLLFRLRAKNETAPAIQAVKAEAAKLRQTFGSEFKQMQQVSTVALSNISTSLTDVASKVPILGSTLGTLTSEMTSAGAATAETSGVIGAMGGPIGIAVTALSAELAILVGVSKALFGVAKATADFQGALFDMSQQTGVSVETLSALEVAAKRVGGGIEGIVQPLGIFQGHLDEAQESGSKMAKVFQNLGVETDNTEVALRQTLAALAKMPEGFHQTTVARELFGRGGRVFLAILKETNGDLDALTRKLKELGVVVSTEDAKAADDFNDQLAILQFQLRGMTGLIGKEVIPIILTGLKQLEKILKENKDGFEAMGVAAKGLTIIIGAPILGAIQALGFAWKGQLALMQPLINVYERLALAIQKTGTAVKGGIRLSSDNQEVGGEVGDTIFSKAAGEARKAAIAARKAFLEESDDIAKKELEQQRSVTEQLRFDHEARGNDLLKFYERQQQLVEDRLRTLQSQIDRERATNEQAFAAGEVDQAAFENRKRDLDQRAVEAQNKRNEDIRRLKLESARADIQAEIKFREQAAAVENARRDGELQRFEDALERGAILESESLTKRLEYMKAVQVERIGLIAYELSQEATSAERKQELNTLKAVSERKYTDEFKRLTQERIDALARENAISFEGVERKGDLESLPEPPKAPTLFDPGKNVFDDIQRSMEKTLGMSKELATGVTDILASSFQNLAQGVGQAVQAFVLFGKVEGGFRRFAAEMIAQIAAMAAVQAVYQLAQGLAWTALNFFFPNPAYVKAAAAAFASAAVFGSIAGVAAVAGRAVSGNAFNQQGGSAGGGGGGTASGNTRPKDPTPVNLDRNNAQGGGGVVEIRFAAGIEDFLEARWIEKYLHGGRIRKLVQEDRDA